MGKSIIVFYKQHRAFVLYFSLGILTTISNYAVYLPLYNLCDFSATLSNGIAWIVSVFVAFLTNKPFVFESHNWSKEVLIPEMIRFVGCRVSTLIVESVAILLFVDIFGFDGNITKIAVSLIVVLINFFASKYIVFRCKHG